MVPIIAFAAAADPGESADSGAGGRSIPGGPAGMIPDLDAAGSRGTRMDARRTERDRSLLALARSGETARGRRRDGITARDASPHPTASGSPAPDPGRPERDLERLRALGARLVGARDPEMPPRLLAIPDPPAVLFVRGDLGVLPAPQVAIVGSRRATPAGARIARRLAGELAAHGFVVTSGLAQGVDAAAHRGALEAGGRTVAILGSSLDRVYPAGHRSLAERIAGQGALVSEFPFGTPPVPWNFPWRNRIISGLSLGVLVVEAAARSGSLVTARLAADQGREVFAVPGSILNPLSSGCHRLLRDGAKLVERVEDVLEELPAAEVATLALGPPESRRNAGGESPPGADPVEASAPGPDAAAVLDRLDYEPASVETIARRAGLTPEQVWPILLTLEFGGSIRMDPAGRYMRVC